jgi:hypothetical protein
VSDDNFWKQYQIVAFHRSIGTDFEFANQLIQKLNSLGVATVCDIDDYWMPGKEHPIHDVIRFNKLNEKIVANLKVAKYVTTTTSLFADEISKINKNVFVFPNAINPNESQFKEPTEESDRLRVGWLGGSSHLHDLELLDQSFSKLTKYKDELQFVICGFDTRGTVTEINQQTGEHNKRDIKPHETVWAQYEKIFTQNYSTISEEYKKFLEKYVQDGYQNEKLLKNIADLYQIWCFLEIKNVLQNLLGKDNPDDVDLAEIQIDDFVFKIERGVKSKVSFNKTNGEIIDLFHDFSYDTSENQNVKSFTVNQRPDIVLRITKNDLKEKYVLTYLYDAKYRLASDEKEGSPDLPTEDSINQMHRYRDAIYYVNKEKVKPEKEVIGAYILFPGSGEIETIKNLDYYKSIESINIGAFPLRPNDYTNRSLLEDHLKTIIGLDTESVLNDVSPQKESTYESPNPYVLIGFVPSENHMLCFENSESPFYFSGTKKPTKFGFKNLKYFAPYIKEKGVKDYYEILDYQITERKNIFKTNHPLYKNESDERLVIRLGHKFQIDQGKFLKISDGSIGQIPYRYTNLKNIRTPLDNKVEVLKVSQ